LQFWRSQQHPAHSEQQKSSPQPAQISETHKAGRGLLRNEINHELAQLDRVGAGAAVLLSSVV
jgi:hypothetical protein